ncbi:MAG: SDR family NAD(P)-dependent oxidoreductase [Gammaproteobacteria bacterium]
MKQSAVILGVGPEQGLGAALARRCAQEGLVVFLGGRSADKLQCVAESIETQGGEAVPRVADATDEENVRALFAQANTEDRALAFAAYTVDRHVSSPLLDTTVELFTSLWQQNTLGGFLFGREAARQMLASGKGSIFFTGATASLRAKPPFTAFSAAKTGLRALANGMAREFGPKGLHVVHIVIDGVIDGDRARKQFPELVAAKGESGLLELDAIAETYWQIHSQPPSAWTHELDLRPFKEVF